MSNPEQNESLYDTFTQYSQRCTICTDWLIGDEELVADPNHKWQVVHKSCLPIIKKRKIFREIIPNSDIPHKKTKK